MSNKMWPWDKYIMYFVLGLKINLSPREIGEYYGTAIKTDVAGNRRRPIIPVMARGIEVRMLRAVNPSMNVLTACGLNVSPRTKTKKRGDARYKVLTLVPLDQCSKSWAIE